MIPALAGLLLAACAQAPGASSGASSSPDATPGPTSAATMLPTASPVPTAPTARWSTTGPCPPQPWTLASILGVPSGYVDDIWSQETASRARCFGSANLRFTASVSPYLGLFLGVELPGSMGQSYLLRPSDEWTSLAAWVPSGAAMDEPTRLALGRTGGDGGLGMKAWFEVAGHFNDPAAAECRPRAGDALDDRPVRYTDTEAVAFCLDQFVIEALTWAQPETTPVPTLPASLTRPLPPSDLMAGKFAAPCPGNTAIRPKFPCVAVALAWTPAPGTVALYRIYENWTGEGPDVACQPLGELVYTSGVGATNASFGLSEPATGGGGRCLYIEAANSAGTSTWVQFEGQFAGP